MKYLVLNRTSLEPSRRKDGKFNLLVEMLTLRDKNFKYIRHIPIDERALESLTKAKFLIDDYPTGGKSE